MDLFSQISLTIGGAIFGALFSFVLPIVIHELQRRKRPQLLGEWMSAYRPDFRESAALITEVVEIDSHFGRLRLRNRNNNDRYIVSAELLRRMYLIGQWESVKPGANAFGAVILTGGPLGNLMCGYFTGLGNTGERTYCAWALGRSEPDLNKALELLKENTLNSLQDTLNSLQEGRTNASYFSSLQAQGTLVDSTD